MLRLQFISCSSGGDQFDWITLATGGEKGSSAWHRWPFTMAGAPVITGHAPHDSPWREPALRHVVRNGDSSTAVRVIRATDELGGYSKLSRNRARVDLMPRFLLARAYLLTTMHESRRAINHRRRITGDGQGGEPWSVSVWGCTVP
jgi:hypothetical protein